MNFVVCTNSHSPKILSGNLRRSPCLDLVPLHVEEAAPSASLGYNRAIDSTDEDVLVLAHHDVYLPRGWERLLALRIGEIESRDPNWAVLACYGIDGNAVHWGPVWSSSIGSIIGKVPSRPVDVRAIDELLIVLRRSSDLRFDEDLPGWHLYGTDIVQSAIARGLGAYAGGLPCIHNDGFKLKLGADFAECYRHLQRKWFAQLPISTSVTKISVSGLALMRTRWHAWRSAGLRSDMTVATTEDPSVLAARCGWADLAPSAEDLARFDSA